MQNPTTSEVMLSWSGQDASIERIEGSLLKRISDFKYRQQNFLGNKNHIEKRRREWSKMYAKPLESDLSTILIFFFQYK